MKMRSAQALVWRNLAAHPLRSTLTATLQPGDVSLRVMGVPPSELDANYRP
jgi:hypothetical protein